MWSANSTSHQSPSPAVQAFMHMQQRHEATHAFNANSNAAMNTSDSIPPSTTVPHPSSLPLHPTHKRASAHMLPRVYSRSSLLSLASTASPQSSASPESMKLRSSPADSDRSTCTPPPLALCTLNSNNSTHDTSMTPTAAVTDRPMVRSTSNVNMHDSASSSPQPQSSSSASASPSSDQSSPSPSSQHNQLSSSACSNLDALAQAAMLISPTQKVPMITQFVLNRPPTTTIQKKPMQQQQSVSSSSARPSINSTQFNRQSMKSEDAASRSVQKKLATAQTTFNRSCYMVSCARDYTTSSTIVSDSDGAHG